MIFFKPTRKYLEYLYQQDDKIIYSNNIIGIVLRLQGFIYFLPVDGIDSSDYDENNRLRKTTPPILRMIAQNGEVLGKCLFSNMFPIPYNEIKYFNINSLPKNEIPLYQKKSKYLNTNRNRIQLAANRIYKQKSQNYDMRYLEYTIDFKKLEELSLQWEITVYKKHTNRFPDSKFFLTNPFTEGSTEYYLMNQETKVAKLIMNNEAQVVVDILKIYHQEFAPLECIIDGQLTSHNITEWFRGRGIPTWRDGLDDMLDNLGIKNKDVLLSKAFGLSLSDQYWMNPVHCLMDWKDINFFDNDFNSQDYLDAMFENKVKNTEEVDFFTPNNTSDGMQKKAWIVEKGKRYMLKGSYKQKQQEPFNEVLASMICHTISLDYVPYSIEQIGNIIVSKCQCFIDKSTELLSAYAILRYYNIDYKLLTGEEIFEKYIIILEKHGIQNVRSSLIKMFVLDYLMINKDRHLGNFGVIRNVESLQWECIAPNFDSGQSLFAQESIEEMNFSNTYGRFFGLNKVDYESILLIIKKHINIKINCDELRIVANKWKSLLQLHQTTSGISNERIEELYNGLKIRIDMIEKCKYKDIAVDCNY